MLVDESAIAVRDIYKEMKDKLGGVVPHSELMYKAELVHQIRILKKEKNAVILGHNYMEPALFHTVPDFSGDSLDLSRKAAATDKDIIVFCGVRFMAETAKILSPAKKVLLPSEKAGCSLAESITAEDVKRLKERYPGVPVVTYVNTYADVKAVSDICCTSGNAAAVVSSIDADTIIFIPDEYLAKNVARKTGKRIVFPVKRNGRVEEKNIGDGSQTDEGSTLKDSKRDYQGPAGKNNSRVDKNTAADYQMIGWEGRCEVHEQFTVEDIHNARAQFPDVTVLAHPECSPEVVAESDYSDGTNGLIRYIEDNNVHRFLLLTECSMADNIIAAHPQKEAIRQHNIRCPHMDRITLEDTLDALRYERYIIDVPEDIRQRAYRAVNCMLEIG